MKLAKTTVYVAEGDYRRLKAIAREQNRTTAELVRDAIAQYARRHGRSARPRTVGLARSGRGDLSERAEELLTGMGRRR
jgi:predicted transcriptional regulator